MFKGVVSSYPCPEGPDSHWETPASAMVDLLVSLTMDNRWVNPEFIILGVASRVLAYYNVGGEPFWVYS